MQRKRRCYVTEWLKIMHKRTHHSVRAIQVTSFYLVQSSVPPVELLCLMVDGKAVGHVDKGGDDGLHVDAIHEGTLDGRSLGVPVGPVDLPDGGRRQSDGVPGS